MGLIRVNKGNSRPDISTASLPDIIFMLLFFFMVVTVMRDSALKVQVITPDASELTKLERRSLVNYLYIGEPKSEFVGNQGNAPRLQLGDKFASLDDIPIFLKEHDSRVPEYQKGLITSSLRVDRNVTMGLVTDVKTALRKSGQYKVNYSAKKTAE